MSDSRSGADFLGGVEPHAPLLKRPADDQLLYKIMRPDHLLASVEGSYLHFNRVDRYRDFPGADAGDGQQLPLDRPGNASAKFEKAPAFTGAHYYDQCRSRTYACCFSTENSKFIWQSYANGGNAGKVGLVFRFDKLRATLNAGLESKSAAVLYHGIRCRQIFSLNYGLVQYIDVETHRRNGTCLPNPITYTYLKDNAFRKEKELRISLSTLGIGQFTLAEGQPIAFPDSLQLAFNFRAAVGSGAIAQILYSPDCDIDALCVDLAPFGIGKAAIATS